MNYKLINKQTNEEHICSKIVIDGFDYYVNDKKNQVILGETYYENDNCIPIYSFTPETLPIEYYLQKIIATNNPSIDLPKVVDEVEELALCENKKFFYQQTAYSGDFYIRGYNKSQESHPFSEEDMIEFYKWVNDPHIEDSRQPTAVYIKNIDMWWYNHNKYTSKELLQIWKEQRVKTIYYN